MPILAKALQTQILLGQAIGCGYNAAGSAGSNKGPSNPDYLKDVNNRIDTLLKYHPYLKRADIPAEMVTASGSGLDPDISPDFAAPKYSCKTCSKIP
jgi:K+-transporting ATPase ATPase C chain